MYIIPNLYSRNRFAFLSVNVNGMKKETQSLIQQPDREFGSEADVERITGRKRATLQKDRFAGRGFPFYKFGRKVVYDLREVRDIIRAGRVDPRGDAA